MKINKKIYIPIILVIIIVLITILLVNNNEDKNDSSKFSNEYHQVPINNKYKYVNIDDAIDILQNKSGIIFMGFSECVWCQDYAKYLNEAIIDTKIDNIYYLDIYKDRKNNTKKYKQLIKILNNNLSYDNMGNHQILVPSTTFVLNGIVVNYDDETSYVDNTMTNRKEYWNDNKIKEFKQKITNYSNSLLDNGVCKDNRGC